MTQPSVLHVDFITLRDPHLTENLLDAAGPLRECESVQQMAVVTAAPGSDCHLALLFFVADLRSLEEFGTDTRYAAFLQQNLAPNLHGLAGIDAAIDEVFAINEGPAALLAVSTPDEAYDWEVRSQLDSWLDAVADEQRLIGLAVGEKQRFRGIAAAFELAVPLAGSKPQALDTMLVTGHLRVY